VSKQTGVKHQRWTEGISISRGSILIVQ